MSLHRLVRPFLRHGLFLLSLLLPPLSASPHQLTVHLLDDVQSDGGGEDGREGERARRLALGGPDGNGGSGSHFYSVVSWEDG